MERVKPTIWQRFKAAKSAYDQISFGSDTNTTPSGSGRNWWIPGTDLNWDMLAGDLWEIPGMSACYHWITRNWLQSSLTVERKKGTEWEAVPDHKLIQLLQNPNEEYDGSVLLMGIVLSWLFNGNFYIGVEGNTYGLPNNLWYIPHFMIKPVRDKTTLEVYYEYNNNGRIRRLDKREVIQGRFGFDPRNPLLGLSAVASASRDGYVMQQDSTYKAKSMKNTGILPGTVTPKLNDGQDLADLQFDPEEIARLWRSKVGGDRAGEPLFFNVPLQYTKIGLTPAELMMETMSDRSEALVCAMLGIPPQVVGLHVGRLAKTYNNMKEARESAWEECIIPNQMLIANQLGNRLLPLTSTQSGVERLTFNTDNIRPLQQDLDALHKRVRDDWLANLIDRATYKLKTNQEVGAGDVGLYYQDTMPAPVTDVKVGERIN